MEAKLKKELETSILNPTGHSGGGCISEGRSYDTDTGRVFVKINHKSEVLMLSRIIVYYNRLFYMWLLKTLVICISTHCFFDVGQIDV